MNCTKLQASLARLKNLSREAAKRLPVFLLSVGMAAFLLPASAQVSPIKKEGEIYYEYIDPVVSTYDQYINLPNVEGQTFYQFKTRGAADKNTRKAQDRAIALTQNRYDSTGQATCVFGPITIKDSPVLYYDLSAVDEYDSSVYFLIKRDLNQPCGPSNQQLGNVDLIRSHITWGYSCPHGYSSPGKDSNGMMMCRRPMVYEPQCCGNPVTHASEKIQYEMDYRSADGLLELKRTYSSSRYPEPGWTTNFDTRVVFNSPITFVVRPDGSRLFFEFDGTSFKSMQPTQAKLTVNAEGYIFSTRDDVSEIYNRAGILTAWLYRDGKKVTLERFVESDTANRLTVTDPYGRSIVLHYQAEPNDGEFYLSNLTLPAGVDFSFNSNPLTGMFESVTREGYLRKYDYDAKKLTGITDENAVRYAEFTYAGVAPLTTTTKHVGDVNSYAITDYRLFTGAGMVTVAEPLGVTASYNYATVNGISRMMSMTRDGQGTTTISYDSNGNTASRTDFNGNLTRYTYNLARNLEISRTEGLSAAGNLTLDTRTIETTWHPVFRLPTKTLVKTSAGVVLQQTTMSYDKFGHIIAETSKDIVLNQARTTTYKYVYSTTLPWHVEKLTIIGPRADVPDTVTTEYWAADAVCAGQEKGCRGKIKSVTNALGQITHYEAYDAHGRPTAIRDANGLLTEMRYTSRGWMTAITVEGETTVYEYDGVGLVKSTALSDGTTISYQYDPVHRLTGISDSLGNSAIYLLDNMGNHLSEVVNDPTGSMKSQVSRVLDNLSRLKKITGAQ